MKFMLAEVAATTGAPYVFSRVKYFRRMKNSSVKFMLEAELSLGVYKHTRLVKSQLMPMSNKRRATFFSQCDVLVGISNVNQQWHYFTGKWFTI